MQNMKLDELTVDKIDIIPTFNIRDDFGDEETRDLEESLKSTNGNIQPIIVCKKGNRYELVSGERRLRGLKVSGIDKALVIIYDNLTEIEKTQLMFNENLGRKHLTWQEELKALKRLQLLGHDLDVGFFQNKKMSKQKIWSLFEGLQAVEEFPELLNEKTRKSCILRYRKLKHENIIDDKKINIHKIVEANEENKEKINKLVIKELKKEVKFYKSKVEENVEEENEEINIFEAIKKADKTERLSNGIWLSSEIKLMIEASRTCETFGQLEEGNKECKECKKESPNVYSKCEFYRDEIEKT